MLNSLMRTVVPALYLLLIHLGLAHGIAQPWELDVISVLVLAAIYLLLRLLEQRWRFVGILLGWIGAPSYDQPAHDAVDQAQAVTLQELYHVLGQFQQATVGLIEGRIHSIVSDHTTRQTADITTALTKRTQATASTPSGAAVKPAAKKVATVKKAAARKPPAPK